MAQSFISIKKFVDEPYSQILGYPNATNRQIKSRVNELEKLRVSVRLINIHTIKPIDREIIIKAAMETQAILTVEEHSITGGLGSCVAEVLAEANCVYHSFKRLGLNDVFPQGYGNYQEMKALNGLSKDDIVREVNDLLDGNG